MAVSDVLMCDIAHWGIKGKNVIIQHNPSMQDCKTVLLDLSFCSNIGPPEVEMISFKEDVEG